MLTSSYCVLGDEKREEKDEDDGEEADSSSINDAVR